MERDELVSRCQAVMQRLDVTDDNAAKNAGDMLARLLSDLLMPSVLKMPCGWTQERVAEVTGVLRGITSQDIPVIPEYRPSVEERVWLAKQEESRIEDGRFSADS